MSRLFRTRRHILIIPVLAFVMCAGVAGLGCLGMDENGGDETEAAESQTIDGLPPEFAKLAEVWEILEREHIDAETLDPAALTDGAIRGMLEATGDEHASYLDPEQYSFQRQEIRGTFEGIGAEVTMRNGLITIVAPIDDTPADRAGVESGDVILEIDGESVAGWDLFQAINRIRGRREPR